MHLLKPNQHCQYRDSIAYCRTQLQNSWKRNDSQLSIKKPICTVWTSTTLPRLMLKFTASNAYNQAVHVYKQSLSKQRLFGLRFFLPFFTVSFQNTRQYYKQSSMTHKETQPPSATEAWNQHFASHAQTDSEAQEKWVNYLSTVYNKYISFHWPQTMFTTTWRTNLWWLVMFKCKL